MEEAAEGFHVKGVLRKGVLASITHALEARGWEPAEPADLDADELHAGVHRAFYVAEQADGWVSVFPNRWDSAVPEEVSRILAKPVLMLTLFEDGVFLYHLFVKGKLVDSYKSDPDFLDPHGMSDADGARANPEAIRPILPEPSAGTAVDILLNSPAKAGGGDLIERFAALLKIQRWRGTYALLAPGEGPGADLVQATFRRK